MTVAGVAVLLYLLWFGFCAFCYYYIGPYQMMPVDLSQPVEIESDPFDLNILKVRGILFVDNMTDNSHMFKLSPARCKAAEMVDCFWEQSPNPLSVSGWDLYQNSVDRYLKSPFSLEENGDLYNETTDTLIAENVRGYIYKDGKLYYDRVEENQFVFYHDKKQIAAMPAWGEVFAYEVVDHFLVVACEKPLNNSIRIWNLEKNQMEFEHKTLRNLCAGIQKYGFGQNKASACMICKAALPKTFRRRRITAWHPLIKPMYIFCKRMMMWYG